MQFKLNFTAAWHILLALFFVFFVTFLVFPGFFWASSFDFLDGANSKDSWNQVDYLILFNIFDTVGRTAGGKLHIPSSAVIALSISRILILSTTIIIATGHFGNDWARVTNMVLYAFTNGYVST